MSTGVRQRPSETEWVVTQFVTQIYDDHVPWGMQVTVSVLSRDVNCWHVAQSALSPSSRVVGSGVELPTFRFQV
jgi:hypothetical protein